MKKENWCLLLRTKNELCLENRTIPEPSPNEVLVAVQRVGICGSDIHQWKNGHIGEIAVKKLSIIGHEVSGTIVKVGENVKKFKKGDKVCLEPGPQCGKCEFCKEGKYNHCPDSVSISDFYGRQYHCHNAELCFKLPDNVSLEEGALVEPLAVAVHACKRSQMAPGKSVLICGAGAIGLLNLLVCKSMGASNVCVTDICENRLKLAKRLGAKSTVYVKDLSTEEIQKSVTSQLKGSPDITLECSGAESSIRLGIKATKSGGVLMLVGLGAPEVKVPLIEATIREVDIRGVYRYVNCYPTAIELVASGAVNLKPLLTHNFPLKDFVKAFQTASTGAGDAIKVLIHFDE